MLRPPDDRCRAVTGNVAPMGTPETSGSGRCVLIVGAESALGRRVTTLLESSGAVVVGSVSGPGGDGPQPDTVIDLTVGDHDALAARRSSVTEAGQHLLDLLGNSGIDHLVLVSSALVYGAHPASPIPISEDAVLRPEPTFVYARQLAGAEERVDRWRRADPRRSVAVLRPVVTVAAGTSSTLMTALTAGVGQRFGHEDPPAQFLHLDDLASAVATVVATRADGVFNVAPDGWIPGHRIRALAGSQWRVPLPGRAAEVVAAWRWRLQRGPIPPGLLTYTQSAWVIGNDRLRALGWRPTVTNEQAYVEGTEAPWWAAISPKRRQEFALAGAVLGLIGAVLVGTLIGRRLWRRSRPG